MYLASTDIAGVTIVWDVNHGIATRIMKAPMPEDLEVTQGNDFDPKMMGWGVTFLDKRSFEPTKSIVEAMGFCKSIGGTVTSFVVNKGAYALRERNLTVYDITLNRAEVSLGLGTVSCRSTMPTDRRSQMVCNSSVPDY